MTGEVSNATKPKVELGFFWGGRTPGDGLRCHVPCTAMMHPTCNRSSMKQGEHYSKRGHPV